MAEQSTAAGAARPAIPMGVHCAEHPTAALIEDYRAGDQICSSCGLVVGDR